MSQHLEDEQILSIFNEGNDSYAFHLLVNKYKQKLYLHIRRIVISHDDADDVLQNTFIKIWKALPNFKQESALFTWLYRIATNEALSFLKKKNRFLFIPIENVKMQLSEKLESTDFINADEIQKKLQKAILSLPEKQRLVFNMRYYDELTFEEISKILKTSTGGLKANYHHAVKKIEDFLKNN